ncbi:hypothetical protein PIB30_097951 [Stylosanthes scabra]|uniref:Uncharacterized protein n=1 Tax=Stylosanthes scabra TaxID=79078 RepID=A0ABU6UXL1_9FABA|nr:hypothetical protein [Stylosanthes scabra]
MEQKHVLLSALSVGVGLGVGLGLSTGQAVQKWVGGINHDSDEISGDLIVLELKKLLLDGRDLRITFDDFPYYLSEKTSVLLTSAAHVHLRHLDFSKHTRNLSPASRAILLSGPGELYQQMLARALAHQFDSKLLLLDINDFSLKMQSKYGCPKKEPCVKKSISEMTFERMSGLFGSLSILPSTAETTGAESSKNLSKLQRNGSAASDISSSSSHCGVATPAPLKRTSSLCFDEKLFVQSLYKVLVSISETSPIILYIRDVERLVLQSARLYNLLHKMIMKLSGSVLVLASHLIDTEDECKEIDERLTMVFPYNIDINPPEDATHLCNWKSQLEEDMRMIQFQDNKNHITEVLAANDIDCDDLSSICHADTMVLSTYIEEIVVSAISYHLMNTKDPEYRNGKLIISANSLSHGLSLFQEGKSMKTNDSNKENAEGIAGANVRRDGQGPENKNETSIPVTKKDGENNAPAKAEVPDNEFEKRIRPEVIPANEIGVTFADIGSLDEIKESLQELRTRVGEHEAMRKIKNEFMTHWDGLLTRPGEQILVLAATNRPFDLDEAIIRRFERRIMVGLPSVENREKILKTLLAKEKHENLDFKELAAMTEGYTGSDLKNLCITAAYRPVRELLQQERKKDMEKKKKETEGQSSEDASENKEDHPQITLRSLNMDDMRQAKSQVAASFASEGTVMNELKQWNELYGEGGSRKKQQLTYFL